MAALSDKLIDDFVSVYQREDFKTVWSYMKDLDARWIRDILNPELDKADREVLIQARIRLHQDVLSLPDKILAEQKRKQQTRVEDDVPAPV